MRWPTMDRVKQFLPLRDRSMDKLRGLIEELRKTGTSQPSGAPGPSLGPF